MLRDLERERAASVVGPRSNDPTRVKIEDLSTCSDTLPIATVRDVDNTLSSIS